MRQITNTRKFKFYNNTNNVIKIDKNNFENFYLTTRSLDILNQKQNAFLFDFDATNTFMFFKIATTLSK